ncbi:MAG TPA: hypothetical protein VFP15_06460 [Gemmatimonadaceae bacterium]|nr:hypothetical protein [Gemmatimonadaceae bacterium]
MPVGDDNKHKVPADLALLGTREGVCPFGVPHPFDPDNCELDDVVLEQETQREETSQQAHEHMRQHAHVGVPSRHDLARLAAAGTPHTKHGAQAPHVARYLKARKGAK